MSLEIRLLLSVLVIMSLVISTGCNGLGVNRQSSSIASSTDMDKTGGVPILITTDRYEGVILADDTTSTWTPDKKIIDQLESELPGYLNGLTLSNSSGNDDSKISFVKSNFKNYKRQYIGKTVEGKKAVYCNFITIGEWDKDDNWKKHYVVVKDGGAGFFSITYSVDEKRFFGLSINGEA